MFVHWLRISKCNNTKATITIPLFFASMVAALLVITYGPSVSLWLPEQTQQLKQVDVDKAHFMNQPSEQKAVSAQP